MKNLESDLLKKLKPTPKSEREEHVAPHKRPEQLGVPPLPALAKVELSSRVLEQQREAKRERQESRLRADQIREQMRPPAEKFQKRSILERDLAGSILEEFKDELNSGKISDERMDYYGHELGSIRNRIENLQAEARSLPEDEDVQDILDANLKTLNEVEAGIRASKMEARNAKYELRYGAGVHATEVEKEKKVAPASKQAKAIVQQIEERYGAHPEALMNGTVPGFKGFMSGLKFRLLNSLSHIAGQTTEYDRYREAISKIEHGLAAKDERAPHERRRRAPKKEVAKEIPEEIMELSPEDADVEITEEVPPPPASLMESYKKSEAEQQESMMTIDKAKGMVKNADRLWDLVNTRLDKDALAASSLSAETSMFEGDGNAATNFVFLVARYMEAHEKQDQAAEKSYHDKVMGYAKKLKIDNNALLSSILSEPVGPKDVLAGVKRRKMTSTAQQRRWRT